LEEGFYPFSLQLQLGPDKMVGLFEEYRIDIDRGGTRRPDLVGAPCAYRRLGWLKRVR
jgi:hypothetical protein